MTIYILSGHIDVGLSLLTSEPRLTRPRLAFSGATSNGANHQDNSRAQPQQLPGFFITVYKRTYHVVSPYQALYYTRHYEECSHNVICITKQLLYGGVKPMEIACHLERCPWLLAPLTVTPLKLGRAKSVCSLI